MGPEALAHAHWQELGPMVTPHGKGGRGNAVPGWAAKGTSSLQLLQFSNNSPSLLPNGQSLFPLLTIKRKFVDTQGALYFQ